MQLFCVKSNLSHQILCSHTMTFMLWNGVRMWMCGLDSVVHVTMGHNKPYRSRCCYFAPQLCLWQIFRMPMWTLVGSNSLGISQIPWRQNPILAVHCSILASRIPNLSDSLAAVGVCRLLVERVFTGAGSSFATCFAAADAITNVGCPRSIYTYLSVSSAARVYMHARVCTSGLRQTRASSRLPQPR